MTTLPDLSLGRRVMALIEELALHTDEPGRITRLYLSRAHRSAAEATLGMMRKAGMDASIDALGSVVGRIGGAMEAPALIIGSHIDSVVDAGRYDGNLGVVLGIVAVEAMRERGVVPPFPIEVVAFGDEENVRFPTNLSTSQGLAGSYDPGWLDGRDADGITLRDALHRPSAAIRMPSRPRPAIRPASAAISRSISSRVPCSRRAICRSASSPPSMASRGPGRT